MQLSQSVKQGPKRRTGPHSASVSSRHSPEGMSPQSSGLKKGESRSEKKYAHLTGEASSKQRGLLRFLIQQSSLDIPEGWSVFKIKLSKQEASDLIGDMKKGDNTGLLSLLMRKPDEAAAQSSKVSAKMLCEAVIKFLEGRTFKVEETQTEAEDVLRKAASLYEFIQSKQ